MVHGFDHVCATRTASNSAGKRDEDRAKLVSRAIAATMVAAVPPVAPPWSGA